MAGAGHAVGRACTRRAPGRWARARPAEVPGSFKCVSRLDPRSPASVLRGARWKPREHRAPRVVGHGGSCVGGACWDPKGARRARPSALQVRGRGQAWHIILAPENGPPVPRTGPSPTASPPAETGCITGFLCDECVSRGNKESKASRVNYLQWPRWTCVRESCPGDDPRSRKGSVHLHRGAKCPEEVGVKEEGLPG